MKKVRIDKNGLRIFKCPGCEQRHAITDSWEFNGDVQNPTFSPSILVWWDEGEERLKKRCHSFIKGGKIQFLDDCTHSLAGKTVDLPYF